MTARINLRIERYFQYSRGFKLIADLKAYKCSDVEWNSRKKICALKNFLKFVTPL